MARKRTIDPDSWTDEGLADLSMCAHLMWVGCVSQADDEGRLEWSARQLKIRLFPTKAEATLTAVQSWMDEIAAAGSIVVYKSGTKTYANHTTWKKHQYVNRAIKSKLPPPPGWVHEIEPERPQKPEVPLVNLTEAHVESTEPHAVITEDHVQATESHVPSVSVSVSVSESVSGLHPSGVAAEADETPKRRPIGKREPSEHELAAWAITNALVGEIAPLLNGAMTKRQWCDRNNTFAKGMVESGATAETVLGAFRRLRRADGAPYLQLNWLADAMVAEKAKAKPLRIVPNERKRMWWVLDASAPHGYRLAYGYDREMTGSRSDIAPHSIPAEVAEEMLTTYKAELAAQGVA